MDGLSDTTTIELTEPLARVFPRSFGAKKNRRDSTWDRWASFERMSKKTIFAFAIVALVVIAGGAGARWYVRINNMPAAHPCVNNLRVISAGKAEWVLENQKTTNDTPTWDDLRPFLPQGKIPVCPQGGVYAIGRVGEPPRCSLGERDPLYHSIPQ
jgi:hypothetical protein